MSILVWHTLLFSSKLSCMLRPFDAIQHYLTRETDQNFVLKVYIVITFKVFADFRFESPISIDFQIEILALLVITYYLQRGESICRLSWEVFADFGGNNYTDFGGNNARISL